MNKSEEKIQDDYINKLLDMVDNYAEKTNKSTYKPTDKERQIFGRIVKLVNAINNYL